MRKTKNCIFFGLAECDRRKSRELFSSKWNVSQELMSLSRSSKKDNCWNPQADRWEDLVEATGWEEWRRTASKNFHRESQAWWAEKERKSVWDDSLASCAVFFICIQRVLIAIGGAVRIEAIHKEEVKNVETVVKTSWNDEQADFFCFLSLD